MGGMTEQARSDGTAGPREQRFQLRISVRVEEMQARAWAGGQEWYPTGSGGLEVSDTLVLTARGFMEVAGILGRFHELAEQLRAAHAREAADASR